MKKKIRLLITVSAITIGGYFAYSHFMGSSTSYSNKQIDLPAVAAIGQDVCAKSADNARLICLADALKATASPEILAKLQLPYDIEEAKKWSNFPPAGYRDRVGATLGEFTSDQLIIVKAMLKQAASDATDEGYDEIEQILSADEFLAANTTDQAGFASGNYHLAFIGTPAASGTWEFYFGGHHLAFGNTYMDGKLVGATPSFRGVEPFTPFERGGHEHAPLVQEQAAFVAMLKGLSSEEQAKAKLAEVFTSIIVGPQQDGTFSTEKLGIKIGDLSPEKQALVIAAIETYVHDIHTPDADALMEKYKAELADTYLAFSGTIEVNAENDYVRIDGPSLWIENSMQAGRSLPGVHPHSIWRDKNTDYGGNK